MTIEKITTFKSCEIGKKYKEKYNPTGYIDWDEIIPKEYSITHGPLPFFFNHIEDRPERFTNSHLSVYTVIKPYLTEEDYKRGYVLIWYVTLV